jgi:hypothetical protein
MRSTQHAVALKEPFMPNHRSTQPHLLLRILRLHITLSDRLDAAAIEQWRERLHDHVSADGLVVALSPKPAAVLSVRGSITCSTAASS